MRRLIYITALIVIANCSGFSQYTLNLSGAAFTPSTIATSGTSTLQFSYLVPSSSEDIPANSVNIIVEMPTSFYEPTGTVPSGAVAVYFDWVLSGSGVWTGTNNTTLGSSFFDPTSGGIIEVEVEGLTDTGGLPQPTNVNPQEVSFLNPVNGTGTSASMIVSTVLPVELVLFEGDNKDCSIVDLSWRTASETNNDGFFVERSSDGKDFEEVGFVKGNNTVLIANDYSFSDKVNNVVHQEILYYRLRQIDLDGRFEYSDIIEVKLDCNSRLSMTAFPNPVVNELNITVSGNLDQVDEVIMMNSLNQVVRTFSIDESGQLGIDMRSHNAGVYYFKLVDLSQQVIDSKKIINLGR